MMLQIETFYTKKDEENWQMDSILFFYKSIYIFNIKVYSGENVRFKCLKHREDQ